MKKLTEKDAIWCKTQKQWDSIIKMFGLDILSTAFERYPKNCITPIGKGTMITSYGNKKFYKNKKDYTIHKAKDILNKSKIKELEKRLDGFDKLLHFKTREELETGFKKYPTLKLWWEFLETNPLIDTEEKKINLKKLQNKLTEEVLKFDLPTKELEELPEKWCVALNKKSYYILNNWGRSLYPSIWVDLLHNNYMNCNLSENFIASSEEIPESYTEITFDQFKKWVLKEEEKPISIREVQVKVSNQEEANECAEIAKACGEEIDFECLGIVNKFCYFRKANSVDYFGVYSRDFSAVQISLQEFRERFGKKQETEIDWSKAGQLVINENGYVIITSGKDKGSEFSGTQLNVKKDVAGFIGYFSKSFHKSGFKLCTEPITLKNE